MTEQLFPQPISRETIDYVAVDAAGGAEGALDIRGNSYLFTDDATTANADYAAVAGKWEKFAQPGFDESARGIALDAQIEAAHDDAIWEDHRRWQDQQDREQYDKDMDAYWAERDAEEQAAEERERQAYLNGDDEHDDRDGDLEARCGISNQESAAVSYYSDEELAAQDADFDGDYDPSDDEDPLAGDVDRYVPDNETADPGLAWGLHAAAARQHGDLTES
jgi:hypothetical protein